MEETEADKGSKTFKDTEGNIYGSVEEMSVAVRFAPTENVSIWLFEYRSPSDLTQSELHYNLIAGRPWWVQLYKSVEIFGPDSNFYIGYCLNTTEQNIVLLGYYKELVPAQSRLARCFNAYLVADGNPLERDEFNISQEESNLSQIEEIADVEEGDSDASFAMGPDNSSSDEESET